MLRRPCLRCWNTRHKLRGVLAGFMPEGASSPQAQMLANLQDLFAGDLIATGTPAGCAARAPGRAIMIAFKHFFSDAGKWKLFVQKNAGNPAYLRPGDQLSVTIRTDDGLLDLGEQTTKIVQP